MQFYPFFKAGNFQGTMFCGSRPCHKYFTSRITQPAECTYTDHTKEVLTVLAKKANNENIGPRNYSISPPPNTYVSMYLTLIIVTSLLLYYRKRIIEPTSVKTRPYHHNYYFNKENKYVFLITVVCVCLLLPLDTPLLSWNSLK